MASKFAELMRLVPTAVNYVLYPRFARLGQQRGDRRRPPPAAARHGADPGDDALPARRHGGRRCRYCTGGCTAAPSRPPRSSSSACPSREPPRSHPRTCWVSAGQDSIQSGWASARPSRVTLDVILIPRYGAMGGAITSAVTYLTTTTVLVILARRQSRAITRTDGAPAGPVVGADSGMRRAVDVLVAGTALAIIGPVIVPSRGRGPAHQPGAWRSTGRCVRASSVSSSRY